MTLTDSHWKWSKTIAKLHTHRNGTCPSKRLTHSQRRHTPIFYRSFRQRWPSEVNLGLTEAIVQYLPGGSVNWQPNDRRITGLRTVYMQYLMRLSKSSSTLPARWVWPTMVKLTCWVWINDILHMSNRCGSFYQPQIVINKMHICEPMAMSMLVAKAHLINQSHDEGSLQWCPDWEDCNTSSDSKSIGWTSHPWLSCLKDVEIEYIGTCHTAVSQQTEPVMIVTGPRAIQRDHWTQRKTVWTECHVMLQRYPHYATTKPLCHSPIIMMEKSWTEKQISKKSEIAPSDRSSPTDKSIAHMKAVGWAKDRQGYQQIQLASQSMFRDKFNKSTKILLHLPAWAKPQSQ